MDGLVEDGDWEFSDVFEHDYGLSPIKECFKCFKGKSWDSLLWT